MNQTWDLLVVGGGTAGIVSAKTAAGFGATVILVERHRTGGDCLWTGCVPSKSILAAASVAAGARDGASHGVHVGDVSVDFSQVREHVRSAIRTIQPDDSPAALEAAGVHVQHGNLRFSGPTSAVVDGQAIEFDQAIVCSGSSPLLPPIPGLAEAAPLTNETVWDLDTLPRRLAILGGGNIGCELGQAFARLGSTVTIVEGADRIMGQEDAQAAEAVTRSMTRDGVVFRTGVPVVEVKSAPDTGALVLEDGTTVDFDRLLVSVGRQPRTGTLNLEAAGVDLDERGHVCVDRHLRTSNIRIWAAGDVTGEPQFTHTAGVNGSLAASNAVLGLRRKVDSTTVPRVTFTSPEVAAVGVSTEDAVSISGLDVVSYSHEHLDRAVTESDVDGFTKIVVDGNGRILGGTVVGPRAGETIGELTLAVKNGMRTRDIAGTTHPYPTFNDGFWNASIADVRARLESPAATRATRTLATARRWWVRSSLTRGRGSRPRSSGSH